MNFNQVVLGGRLTRDPQVRDAGGERICEFSIAVNEKRGENEKAHFFDITAFGKSGELIAQHMRKGREILLSGRLDHQTWEAKDGTKRSKVAVILNTFQFVGPRQDAGGGDHDVSTPAPTVKNWDKAKMPARATAPPMQQPFGDEQQIDPDSIPF